MIDFKPPDQIKGKKPYDIILISGDYYADHPQSGVGVIARVLDSEGYRIGIIEKPNWKTPDDFMKLGLPRLFFGVTSGALDSMLRNYTPLKKPRSEDPYKPYNSGIPDRALIVYAQKIREAQKILLKQFDTKRQNQVPIVLGGVEASLRRFTHYDYWSNKLRRSILFDAKADILVYGNAEYQVKEIAKRLKAKIKDPLIGIAGTCIISNKEKIPEKFEKQPFIFLPSYDDVSSDKVAFCKMQMGFSNQKNLIQKVGNRYLVQFRMHTYTTAEMDWLYSLPFSYDIPDRNKELKMAQFSIITHRGCFGNCSFCAIALHQGTKIISRSEDNIVKEIHKMMEHPKFKGYIGDLGGPSANMYGMDCPQAEFCLKQCISCKSLNSSHQKISHLLKRSREIPGIKKVFVRSGIRYDLAVDEDEYLKELSNHISGSLKIAPEHFSPKISKLMNKDNSRFDEFQAKFNKINNPLHQTLKYYFITAHPGSTMDDARDLRRKLQKLGFKNTESIQIFTPTPMSISTCMYYTGLNPYSLEKIYIPYSYNEKKRQKNILYPSNLPNSSNLSNISNSSNSINSSNPSKYPNRSYKARKSR
ncbi:MAG: YgiQ family radical SAM protein [Promethearchaeota archaeon]